MPPAYDPARVYQVRIQLHGGISAPRDTNERRWRAGIGRLAGAEQIYVLPAAWNEAPWWSDAQIDNLRGILDAVKRTYNVDENRVVLSGVSDGGTGAYFVGMLDTTPYASFLPLNGYILVLQHTAQDGRAVSRQPPEQAALRRQRRARSAVSDGRRRADARALVERRRDDYVYKPQPQAGHDTTWWPEVKDAYEAFVHGHPRVPFPETLTWETADPHRFGRAHWLQIDAIGQTPNESRDLPDLNVYTRAPSADLGFRLAPGLKVDRVIKGSMAARLGLERNDVIQQVGGVALHADGDLVSALQTYRSGMPIKMTVVRSERTIELSGTFEPDMIESTAEPMFRHTARSGRVDLVRRGNTIDAETRGVTHFTLLLSPDQCDFAQPIHVTVNGRPAFDGRSRRAWRR